LRIFGINSKINANAPKAMFIYSKFFTEILNDKEKGNELKLRAKELTSRNN